MTDEQHDQNCERREALVRQIGAIMGWDYHQSPIYAGLRKVAIADATVIGLDKLEQIIGRLEGLTSIAAGHQKAVELLERVVVASHMRQHAALRGPTFEECREGFCGEYHKLAAK